MKKIKLTPQNAFLGAEVSRAGKTFYVVKVNEKTFYASEEKDFLILWERKLKGVTWKNFCEGVGHRAKSYKYDDFEITEDEAAKKESIEAKKEIHEKNQKHLFTGQVKKEVHQMWKRFLEKEKRGKGKTWLYSIEVGNKIIHPMAASLQAKAMLFHVNSDYIFYFVEDDVYVPFDRKEHKLGKEIVWPVSPLEEVKR